MTSFKILPSAASITAGIALDGSPAAQAAFEALCARASRADGDRVLDRFEAQALAAAYGQVAPSRAATAEDTAAVQTALETHLAAYESARPAATEVMFTSEGDAITRFRQQIIGTWNALLAEAGGRPVDINVMIFSFTDKVLADAMLELAAAHPNATFRVLTDWSSLATSGGRQPRRILKLARERGLDNVLVKFKKDAPYVWDPEANAPAYNHGATTGLNHHKGFVGLIDGRPHKLALGSYNWSVSALTQNHENLMLLDREDAAHRPVLEGFQAEFESFWNHDGAALTEYEALVYKNETYAQMHAAHGVPYTPVAVSVSSTEDPLYDAVDHTGDFDLNSFADADAAALEAAVGRTLAGAIQRELEKWGRCDSFAELLERVPGVGKLPVETLEAFEGALEYGAGGLPLNTASVTELDRAGLSRKQAEGVVALRDRHGAFEAVEEITAVPGIGPVRLAQVRETLHARESLGFYSGTVPGQPTQSGFSPTNHGTFRVPAAGVGGAGEAPAVRGEQVDVPRNLAAPLIDMLRRAAPGETVELAMYGVSIGSPEYRELDLALRRGVKAEAVLNADFNGDAIKALQALRASGGAVELYVISSKEMHEKFVLRGDDVANGSANMSSSSITKHAEDRYYLRNVPATAAQFRAEFARLKALATKV